MSCWALVPHAPGSRPGHPRRHANGFQRPHHAGIRHVVVSGLAVSASGHLSASRVVDFLTDPGKGSNRIGLRAADRTGPGRPVRSLQAACPQLILLW